MTRKSYAPSRSQWFALGGLFLFAVLMYSALLLPADTYTSVIREDRWIEGSGALTLLAGSIFFFLAYVHARKTGRSDGRAKLARLCLLGLAVVFFVSFGEEFSWGQRIFGWGTPESLASGNAQGESNVHNLKVLDEGWLNPDRAFMLFWVGFGVVLPLAYALWGSLRRFLDSFRYLPIVPLVVGAALVVNQFMFWAAERIFEGRYFNPYYDLGYSAWETKESVAEFALMLGAFYVYRQLKRRSAAVTAADEVGADDEAMPARRDSIGRRQPIGV
jgi:hypothetical protein